MPMIELKNAIPGSREFPHIQINLDPRNRLTGLPAIMGIQGRDLVNISLLLNKFLPVMNAIRLENAMGHNLPPELKEEVNIKHQRLAFTIGFLQRVAPLYKELKQRYGRVAENEGSVILATATRLIVGHGGESALESNIALHYLYGFPIIPGSSIKGVTRHYLEEQYSKDQNLSEIDIFKPIGDDLSCAKFIEQTNLKKFIKLVFGESADSDEKSEGEIVFMDAWPEDLTDLLEVDVLNPHYKEYYETEGSHPPSDTLSPKPHYFLAVRKDKRFSFYIRYSTAVLNRQDKALLNCTRLAMVNALKDYGIGGKTGASYGYFREA